MDDGIFFDDAHAFAGAGGDNRADTAIDDEGAGRVDDVFVGGDGHAASGFGKFLFVGCDDVGTGIDVVVAPLRVDENFDVALLGERDERGQECLGQQAFAVVGENHDIDVLQKLLAFFEQVLFQFFRYGLFAFKIGAQELLVSC